MLKALGALNNLLGTILALAIVGTLGIGGWIGLRTYYAEKWALEEAKDKLARQEVEVKQLTEDLQARGQEILALNEDLKVKQREIQRLDTAIRLLKVDHRIARIEVLSQQGSAATGDLATTFRFLELDGEGRSIEKPRTFTIKGDLVYVDGLVIKYKDELVQRNDPLRGTSAFLFRRIYGESQNPKDGFALDPTGSQPAAYRTGGKISGEEQEIWDHFWEYANDPVRAAKAGVRAAHGQASYTKLMPGRRYRVELRASDGTSIVPEGPMPTGQQAKTL